MTHLLTRLSHGGLVGLARVGWAKPTRNAVEIG